MDSLDIVVFSDSHGNSARMRDIIDGTGADVVIHLGDGANDIESIEKTDRRRRLYIYVRGNCDFFSSDLPYTREFTLLGRKFLIMHGHTAGVKHGTAALEADSIRPRCGHRHVRSHARAGRQIHPRRGRKNAAPDTQPRKHRRPDPPDIRNGHAPRAGYFNKHLRL